MMPKIHSLVFISNYFNHHQKFLSDAFYNLLGDQYSFIATEEMDDERQNMGWNSEEMPYIRYTYKSEYEFQKCIDLINNADVAIIGAAPEAIIKERIEGKKLCFRYSERLTRTVKDVLKYPYRFIKYHKSNPNGCPIYILCASAYTAADYANYGLFRNKTFKWGYFTEVIQYEDINKMLQKKDSKRILWCGRFLRLKHLDDAIKVAGRLLADGEDFYFDIIGTGAEEDNLKRLVKTQGLQQKITFHGAMKPEQVRNYMERAGIYLFTSDFNEGWGAVLNESMNSGCAVISSHAVGATPFLIKDGENGLVYESGNLNDLYKKTKYLLNNPLSQKKLGEKAYSTMLNFWNPKIVAARFLNLAEGLLDGKTVLFEEGPCSPAEYLKNNWYNA